MVVVSSFIYCEFLIVYVVSYIIRYIGTYLCKHLNTITESLTCSCFSKENQPRSLSNGVICSNFVESVRMRAARLYLLKLVELQSKLS